MPQLLLGEPTRPMIVLAMSCGLLSQTHLLAGHEPVVDNTGVIQLCPLGLVGLDLFGLGP